MATRLDRGYRPPSVATGIGQALGGMGEALMRISSMQSDRVDRAYELARQNRIDERQIQQIDLDTKRLQIETQRHQAALRRANRDDETHDAELTRNAADAWYKMQTESGAFIRMNEQGVPVATEDDVIARIRGGQGIGDITDFNPELSQSFREGMALTRGQLGLETARDDELFGRGLSSTGVPFTAEQLAGQSGQIYDSTLGMAFDNSPEGQKARNAARFNLEATEAAGAEAGEIDPEAFMDDETKLNAGMVEVEITNEDGSAFRRWIYRNQIDKTPVLGGLQGMNYTIVRQ